MNNVQSKSIYNVVNHHSVPLQKLNECFISPYSNFYSPGTNKSGIKLLNKTPISGHHQIRIRI